MRTQTTSLACLLLAGACLTGCGGGGGSGSSPSSASVAPAQSGITPLTTLALTSLAPTRGQPDTEITLRGSGFEQGLAVHFGGQAATNVVVVSSQTIVCRSPAHAPGVVDVAVVTSAGRVELALAYEYTQARVQPQGLLDPTFNQQGFWTADARGQGTSSSTDFFWAVTTDAQGRIVAVGESGLGRSGLDRDMVVYRFLEDGTPDPTFGTQGRATHGGAAGGVGQWDKAEDVAIDALGRIVVSGRSYNQGSPGNADLAVWRFLDDGSLDTSFNGTGFMTHDDAAGGQGWDNGQALTIDALGRIVVAGYSSLPLANGSALRRRQGAVWRVLESGRLDASFGRLGVTILTSTTSDELWGVAIDSAGRIVVGGEIDDGANQDVGVWRLDDTGAVDQTYGLNGRATHHDAGGGAGADAGLALALDGQDRAVLAGRSVVAGRGTAMVVWRFLETGTLDTSFAGQGFAFLDDPGGTAGATDVAYDVAIDPISGRIVAVGNATGTNSLDATVWQLNADGTTDTGFGTAGAFQHDDAAGGQRSDQARGVAIDGQGRILVVGTSWSAQGDNDFAIWRLR